MESFANEFDLARKELLYLGLRNPLINYRPLRARGLELTGEIPEILYDLLVTREKSLPFLSTEAHDGSVYESGHKQEDELPFISPTSYDRSLQTPYDRMTMLKRLYRTVDVASTFLTEQGVNVLYLALGMLRWREKGSDETTRQAPLLLIPVTFRRQYVYTPFQLKYTGGEIDDNVPLRTKLSQEYGIALPTLPEGEVLDIPRHFQNVEDAVRPQPGWSVDKNAAVIGFFSFHKFLMYNDLDATHWRDQPPTEHPVIASLIRPQGFAEPPAVVPENESIDQHIDLDQSYQVVDADSSQTLAILDVKAGRNLVIQGPPGTGKSQTITNLIAESIGEGKTVLFVAEKMAALDVVKRRLDGVGLGDAALVLHSHKTTKRLMLEELERTILLGEPISCGDFTERTELQQARDGLNTYSGAMNEPIANSDITPYMGYGLLMQLGDRLADIEMPPLSGEKWVTWPDAEFSQRVELVRTLQLLLQQMGIPEDHPFFGSKAPQATPALEAQIVEGAEQVEARLLKLQQASQQLASQLHIPAPQSPTDAIEHLKFAKRIVDAPNVYETKVTSTTWNNESDALLDALTAGLEMKQIRSGWERAVIPEAWSQDVLAIRQGLMMGNSFFARLFSKEYRHAKRLLAGLCKVSAPSTWEEQLGMVDAIMESQRQEPAYAKMTSTLEALFGARWNGLDSDLQKLHIVAYWVIRFHQDLADGHVPLIDDREPERILQIFENGIDFGGLRTAINQFDSVQTAYEEAFQALNQLVQWDAQTTEQLEQATFETLLSHLRRLQNEADRLGEVVDFYQQAETLSNHQLGDLLQVASRWSNAGQHLTNLVRYTRYVALIDHALATRPTLQHFSAKTQNQRVANFRRLDEAYLQENRYRLAHTHWKQIPRYKAAGQMKKLQHEMSKKIAHKPIRALMSMAGEAVQAIKPIFMMSPLSIATYLPPGELTFDLVIFDEASQVRPVDAFGAILRGQQTIVVGDSKQMPPTSFFDKMFDEEDGEEETGLDNTESIFDLFIRQKAPQRTLQWHYRSLHESLITVSNQAFYESELVTFPSPDEARSDTGLRYHYLPDATYDRGQTRTNQIEAEHVARAVLNHALTQPHLSLGVATFSTAQRDAIRLKVEQLQHTHPEAEMFFSEHPNEPFFVKNLENVQGDERDVIFISIGYGWTPAKKLSLNFGPLNTRGGERRLNVLITRSKRRCEIFTNLKAADIDLSRTESWGVAVLKSYLHYAETGEIEASFGERHLPAPFEDVVSATLIENGYQVSRRVGLGMMRVDLAVHDPDRPGRYLLGIECDGDNYSLARSARDRDRIQESVLQRLGWRTYRLWSTAWRLDPDGERQRLLAALQQECDGDEEEQASKSTSFILERHLGQGTVDPPRLLPPYEPATFAIQRNSRPLSTRSVAQLADWFAQVVTQESPILVDEVIRRLSHNAGYRKIHDWGPVTDRIIDLGCEKGWMRLEDDFLWLPTMSAPIVRDRTKASRTIRSYKAISPVEWGEALLLVVGDAVMIQSSDAHSETAKLLGAIRAVYEVRQVLNAQIERLCQEKRLLKEELEVTAWNKQKRKEIWLCLPKQVAPVQPENPT
ncbi:MAG: DUF4011 domain-containing protein [Chloroflexota bacterium]